MNHRTSKMDDLYNKVAGNQVLQLKFNQIMAEVQQAAQNGQTLQAVQETTEAKLLAFAKDVGFEVSIAEMQAFFQGMAAQAEGELSDAELDQVAGGKVNAAVVIASVATVGIACAIGSVAYAISGNCNEFFHQEASSEGL